MSASRGKKNFDKRTPKRRSNNVRWNQAVSQGFYDQARQEDYNDTESRFYQPPPEKIPRINDDADVRRGRCYSLRIYSVCNIYIYIYIYIYVALTAVKRKNPTPLPVFAAASFARV